MKRFGYRKKAKGSFYPISKNHIALDFSPFKIKISYMTTLLIDYQNHRDIKIHQATLDDLQKIAELKIESEHIDSPTKIDHILKNSLSVNTRKDGKNN